MRSTALFLTSKSFSYHRIVVFHNPVHSLNWLIETIAVTSAIGLSAISRAFFLYQGTFAVVFLKFFSAFSLEWLNFCVIVLFIIIISAFAICQSLFFPSNYIKCNFQVHTSFYHLICRHESHAIKNNNTARILTLKVISNDCAS